MLKYYLYAFLLSMIPIFELRGAIPYAAAVAAIDGVQLTMEHYVWFFVLAIIGNMLPVPFIFFFARRILEWGADKKMIGGFCRWCLKKGEKGGQKLQAKAGKGLYIALLLFVGIPLPGTGAWTGTLAASFLDMDFKKSVIYVMGGVLLAGLIIGLLTVFGLGAYFGIPSL